jgi:hypothetical protein
MMLARGSIKVGDKVVRGRIDRPRNDKLQRNPKTPQTYSSYGGEDSLNPYIGLVLRRNGNLLWNEEFAEWQSTVQARTGLAEVWRIVSLCVFLEDDFKDD